MQKQYFTMQEYKITTESILIKNGALKLKIRENEKSQEILLQIFKTS